MRALPIHDVSALDRGVAELSALAPNLRAQLEGDERMRPRSLPFAELRGKEHYIIDMDGVLYHGNRILPGVHAFIEWLHVNRKKFLFLTVGVWGLRGGMSVLVSCGGRAYRYMLA